MLQCGYLSLSSVWVLPPVNSHSRVWSQLFRICTLSLKLAFCSCESAFSIIWKSHTVKSHLPVPLEGIVWFWRVRTVSEAVILTHEHQASPVVTDLAVRRRLVKTKMNSSKQTHFKPQHNIEIKFYHPQNTKIHVLVFLSILLYCFITKQVVCEHVPVCTAVIHCHWQLTCETSCKIYSGTVSLSFVKLHDITLHISSWMS